MPRNAYRVDLTHSQFQHIFKKGYKSHPCKNMRGMVTLAQTSNGVWWAEWRGEAVFWASRWYAVPQVVGERAKAIEEFVGQL